MDFNYQQLLNKEAKASGGQKKRADRVTQKKAIAVGIYQQKETTTEYNGPEKQVCPSAGMVIQCRRSNNPFPKNKGDSFGQWGTTAHHIISRDVLEEAYSLLSDDIKEQVDNAAVGTAYLHDPTGRVRQDEVEDIQWREWPQGNLFYGPNVGIRAEETTDKTAMDTDAEYFLSKDDYERLKAFNKDIVGLINQIQQEASESKKNYLKAKLAIVMAQFYKYARNLTARGADTREWTELTREEEISDFIRERPHAKKSTYIKIPASEDSFNPIVTETERYKSHKLYPNIICKDSQYYYLNGIRREKLAAEEKGGVCYIQYANTNIQKVKEHILDKNKTINKELELSTWVPKTLALVNASIREHNFLTELYFGQEGILARIFRSLNTAGCDIEGDYDSYTERYKVNFNGKYPDLFKEKKSEKIAEKVGEEIGYWQGLKEICDNELLEYRQIPALAGEIGNINAEFDKVSYAHSIELLDWVSNR